MGLDWCSRRLFRPDGCFWEPPIGNGVDEFVFLFYFNFLFLPSLPPIVPVCALIIFFEGPQKEGQVLKGYEFPKGKR